jgi:hypothetical protein
MPFMDKSCLYSTVKNTSGGTKKFGFLPPHGRELTADEEMTVFGSILEAVTRFERATDRRQHQGLASALDRGDLEILGLPNPLVFDATLSAAKMIKVDNGSVVVADPCFATSDSADIEPPA